MEPANEQINEIIRYERLQLVCLFFFILGGGSLLFSLVSLGFGGIGNPKSASSIFSVIALSGYLRPFAIPLQFLAYAQSVLVFL